MLDKIKVLLANTPQRVRASLIDLIQCQNDMEVVGEVIDLVELLLAVGETQADVVILPLPDSDEEPGICSHLLAEYRQLLILALSPDRESAFLYQQRISKEQIPKVADEEILAAIREGLAGISH